RNRQVKRMLKREPIQSSPQACDLGENRIELFLGSRNLGGSRHVASRGEFQINQAQYGRQREIGALRKTTSPRMVSLSNPHLHERPRQAPTNPDRLCPWRAREGTGHEAGSRSASAR